MGLLGSCRADVDLNHIDPSAELSMNLALPVGDVSAQMGDFLGMGKVGNYISVREDGVLVYQDTFSVNRPFHNIDLTAYMTRAHKKFDIHEMKPELVGTTLPAGVTVELDCPVKVDLSGLNTDEYLDNERLDSAHIGHARYTSSFSTLDLDLPFSDIERIEMVLDGNVRRPAGKVINIPLEGKGYNQPLEVVVDNFFINFMKDKNQDPGRRNVVNEVTWTFRFFIKPSRPLTITQTSALNYDMTVDFMDYEAIWGWFKPGNKMHDFDTLLIEDEWPEWKLIKNMKLQLAEPKVTINERSELGVPLLLNLSFLKVQSKETGETKYATFNGDTTYLWALPRFVNPGSQAVSPYTDVASNTIVLNEQADNGRLDEMFTIRPDILAYRFEVIPNTAYSTELKQHRLVKNTNIDVDALLDIPFIFNPGVEISYADSIRDINLEKADLDSILTEVEVVDSVHAKHLKLILQSENYIPFNIRCDFTFLDADGNEIAIKALEGNSNQMQIDGAFDIDNRVVLNPTTSTMVIDLEQSEIDKLPLIKTIAYKAFLGENTASCRLLDTTKLKIRIGVAAEVDAFLNLDLNELMNK